MVYILQGPLRSFAASLTASPIPLHMLQSSPAILASFLFVEQSGHALYSVFTLIDSSVWNVLSSDISRAHSLTYFMSLIKCHLINVAFLYNPI